MQQTTNLQRLGLCVLWGVLMQAGAYAETHFYYAYELKESPVIVSDTGEYGVWVWCEGLEEGSIRVGDKGLRVPPQPLRSATADSVWIKAGTLPLDAGAHRVQVGEKVYGVVLSDNPDFVPEGFQHAIRLEPSLRAMFDPRTYVERHTDTIFEMTEYGDLEAWEKDAAKLRRRILASSGLYPLPEKTPLNPVMFDREEFGDYSIEKVYFEAYPGFLVTGNLFRPMGKEGPFPGVLCPHGHWEHGRLEDSEKGSVPARGITLARMGMVAFTYDMLAYNDNLQFKNHRFVNFEDTIWGIHPFGLQLWSGIRGVDFLESLPDVDPERIACTGASGGGTQTFALTAVDPRIKVAAPVNMISHTMQGGCVCENAPFIRMEHSNMEIGALAAPRPLLLVSATGDWTKATPEVEYPAIRSVYELYGAVDKVESVQFDAGHNYNRDSRTAVYRFLGKHLLPEEDWAGFEEPDYNLPPREKLRLFPDGELPAGISRDEREIKENIKSLRRAQLSELLQQDRESLGEYRTTIAEMLGINRGSETHLQELENDGALARFLVHVPEEKRAIPMLGVKRGGEAGQPAALLVVHPRGKHSVFNPATLAPYPEYAANSNGMDVFALDTFLTGEFNDPQEGAFRKALRAFDDTFLPPDAGNRVQDILHAVSALRKHGYGSIHLSGQGAASMWVLFAAALDTGVGGFTFEEEALPQSDNDWSKDRRTRHFYVPGIEAVGGVEMLMKLSARPQRVYVGTYTNGESEGIYLLEFDSHSGALEHKGLAAKTENPSFLAQHPTLPVLYAVGEAGSEGGTVSAFRIEQESGALTLMNRVSSVGAGPCHVNVAPGGRYLAVANYGGGSVAVVTIAPDGSLAEVSAFMQHSGTGTNPQRQDAPHAHSVDFTPDGRFLLVADLGLDKVLVYRFNTQTGALTPNDPPHVLLPPGAGPRHVALHPEGRHLYVINELHNTVSAFAWDAQQGKTDTPHHVVGTLPDYFDGTSHTAEIMIHPSGRFLYASNRGHDSIALFQVDSADGTLAPQGHTLTGGKTPRHFTIAPSGKWLLAANQNSGTVAVFRVEEKDGTLSDTSHRATIPNPVCVLFPRNEGESK